MAKNYWILKTEPSTYAFETLVKDKSTMWDGVRNYQARNNLKAMKKGDACYIYHSGKQKEVVGTAKVVKEHYPDPTTPDPAWVVVDIQACRQVSPSIPLAALKERPDLQKMSLIKQSRLSVCPITQTEWDIIAKM